MNVFHILVLGALAAGAAGAQDPAPKVLFSFDQGVDPAKVPATGVKVALVEAGGGKALALAVGHDRDWPGINLAPAEKTWDLSPYARLCLAVTNTGADEATLHCRVDNAGADGIKNCNTGNLTLAAGATGTLTVELKARPPEVPGVKLFGMRGYPINSDIAGTIDTAKITGLVIFVGKPTKDTAWRLDDIRAEGTAPPNVPPPTDKPFLPFVDTFGQYIHHDWPGKVKSLDDLRARVATEAKDLADHPGPAQWDKWGGLANGPKLDATGFFRVTKHEGKWWLVDPDGRLFWSHGIDCVGSWHSTPTDERESWWQDFPGAQPDLAEFAGGNVRGLHGYYAGKQVKTYSFSHANLKRKYGPEWRATWNSLAHTRLRSWGVNTIGNWSQGDIQQIRRTPYVCTVGTSGKLLEGSTGYWGQFRDVFDPSFAAGIGATMANQKGKAAGDPWCLGFFVDNEIAWGDDVSLATAALASPSTQVAKQVFITDLKAKYGTIEKLNAAWDTKHASWEALAETREAPDKVKARADLTAFYTKFAEQYFRVIRDAVKAAAPNQLYLGCRFAWVNDLAAAQAGRFCDVVSYNLYKRDIATFKTNAGDVPLIVGEFHFGALDRGMFHTGLVPVSSQAERARMYRSYVEGAVKHPQFVGTHWFEFQDEPLTGRWLDEENYQIGFIDQTDTPYPETVAAARAVGDELYALRLGK
ncbi:MAG: beta-galactosidase [Armatimonadetes bacterium]|nr:beta-galactosidase [Armatimonadota bacterium]